MQNEEFSGQAGLDLIQSMINKARNQFGENGHLYLVWGWTILFCSVSQFVLKHFFDYQKHYLVWMITWLTLAYQIFYILKYKRKERVKTYTRDILRQVWFVFAILMILCAFIIGRTVGVDSEKTLTPVFLSLYGMPSFLSGKILQFKPLEIGGMTCWLTAIVALFIPQDFLVLMFGLAVIVAWIIPGYLLQRKYKRELV